MRPSDHDILVRIDENVAGITKLLDDHEQRIRSLEAQQYKWLGRDGAIVAAISAAIAYITNLVSGVAR